MKRINALLMTGIFCLFGFVGCSNNVYGGKATIVRYTIGESFTNESGNVQLTIQEVFAVEGVFIEKEEKSINGCALMVRANTFFFNYKMDYCQLKIVGTGKQYEDNVIDCNEGFMEEINSAFFVEETYNYTGELYFYFPIEPSIYADLIEGRIIDEDTSNFDLQLLMSGCEMCNGQIVEIGCRLSDISVKEIFEIK